MSLAQTTTAPAVGAGRGSLLRWIAGGTGVAAILATVAIGVWPASAADKARDDGEQFGQAVSSLYEAQSTVDVDAALADIHTAAVETRDHAGDAVADQVAAQEDALARAAEGAVGSITADDGFEADVYQAELDVAVDDLTSQAEDFRTEGPEVQQALWEGYETGVSGS
jgi:hypothetical protein